MYWQFTPYVFPVILAVAISAALAIFALRRRPTPGATSFSLLMFAVAEWALGYALELVSPGLPAKLFWDNVSWLGAVVTPAAWFAFTLAYTDRGRWLTRRNVAILTIEPLIILLLVWTNPLHGLVNSHVALNTKGPFSALVFTYGAAFWVDIAYSYLLLLSGAFFIVSLIHSFIRSTSLYKGQAVALLVALVAPWVGNALTIFGWSPFPSLDLTPFAFTITGIAMASSLFRFRLLDIRPIAREVLIENMRDVVLVVDEQNRIVDLNRAAQQVLGHSVSELIGQPAAQVFAAWPQFVERYHDVSEVHEEIVVGEGEAQLCFDLRISPLYTRNGHLTMAGRLVIVNDITERKLTERALRASEERFRHVFEETPIGMAVIGLEGQLLQVNKVFCEMLRYDEQELIGRNFAVFTHPDDVGKDALLAVQALKGAITSYKVEKRYLKKNHETLWADLTTTIIRDHDGQASYGLAMIENIIERKRAKLLEEERRYVAYELHDGLAQIAASAHQHLQAFAGRYHPRSPQARQELDQALKLARRSVTEARRLIAGLRPTALDDFGLATALRLEVELLRADGWTITYDETLGSERLPPTIEITLFRVALEAITNIRKHACTTHIRLALEREGPKIHLEVQDWGCGFDPAAVLHEVELSEHIGLREMQERIELLGGHFEITSRSGSGTLVIAELRLLIAEERSMTYEH